MHKKGKTSPSQMCGGETKAKRHQTNLREKKLTQKGPSDAPTGEIKIICLLV